MKIQEELLRLSDEEIEKKLSQLSISELVSLSKILLENNQTDYEVNLIQKITNKISRINHEKKNKQKSLTFAKKTKASREETNKIDEEINSLNEKITSLEEEIKSTILNVEEKNKKLIEIIIKKILDAKEEDLEKYRNDELDDIQAEINKLGSDKKELEHAVEVALKFKNHNDEENEIKELQNKIDEIELNCVNQELDEATTKKVVEYRNRIKELKKIINEHNPELDKLVEGLRKINTKISDTRQKANNTFNMSNSEYKDLIVLNIKQLYNQEQYINEKISFEILKSKKNNIDNIKEYEELLNDYEDLLDSIKNPSIEIDYDQVPKTILLNEIEKVINDIKTSISNLESKKEYVSTEGYNTKYIKENAINEGLFDVPFDGNKWRTHFEDIIKEFKIKIGTLLQYNKRYNAISEREILSREDEQKLSRYETLISEEMYKLYEKIISNYITSTNQVDVSVFDYETENTYNEYITRVVTSIEKKISDLNQLISTINIKKESKEQEINRVYSKINDLKSKLNRIIDMPISSYIKSKKTNVEFGEKEEEQKELDAPIIKENKEPNFNELFSTLSSSNNDYFKKIDSNQSQTIGEEVSNEVTSLDEQPTKEEVQPIIVESVHQEEVPVLETNNIEPIEIVVDTKPQEEVVEVQPNELQEEQIIDTPVAEAPVAEAPVADVQEQPTNEEIPTESVEEQIQEEVEQPKDDLAENAIDLNLADAFTREETNATTTKNIDTDIDDQIELPQLSTAKEETNAFVSSKNLDETTTIPYEIFQRVISAEPIEPKNEEVKLEQTQASSVEPVIENTQESTIEQPTIEETKVVVQEVPTTTQEVKDAISEVPVAETPKEESIISDLSVSSSLAASIPVESIINTNQSEEPTGPELTLTKAA